MNIQEIDKWLDNEYGVSYTRLEELHDFVVEQDMKHQEEKDKEIERLNKCYCERTDCAGRIKNSAKFNSVEEENERLNNIINELEKELKEDYKIWLCNSRSNGKSVKFGIDVCKTHFYNRLQELKGSESNE